MSSVMQGQPKIANPIMVREIAAMWDYTPPPLMKHWCYRDGRIVKFYTGGNARMREGMASIERKMKWKC